MTRPDGSAAIGDPSRLSRRTNIVFEKERHVLSLSPALAPAGIFGVPTQGVFEYAGARQPDRSLGMEDSEALPCGCCRRSPARLVRSFSDAAGIALGACLPAAMCIRLGSSPMVGGPGRFQSHWRAGTEPQRDLQVRGTSRSRERDLSVGSSPCLSSSRGIPFRRLRGWCNWQHTWFWSKH